MSVMTKCGSHHFFSTCFPFCNGKKSGTKRPGRRHDPAKVSIRPHDLRHTAATVAIVSGADVKSVQDLLGHATASFMLNVYAHTSGQMMKDTAARMQSYYDSLAKG